MPCLVLTTDVPRGHTITERECEELRGRTVVQAVFSWGIAAYVLTDGRWEPAELSCIDCYWFKCAREYMIAKLKGTALDSRQSMPLSTLNQSCKIDFDVINSNKSLNPKTIFHCCKIPNTTHMVVWCAYLRTPFNWSVHSMTEVKFARFQEFMIKLIQDWAELLAGVEAMMGEICWSYFNIVVSSYHLSVI